MAAQPSRRRQIADARLLLDWLEAHPAVPLPDLNLPAILHNSPKAAAAVMNRASSTTDTPFQITPGGGKVLRRSFGSASYRLVSLPPPPAAEPTHLVTPYEPRRTASVRKPQKRQTPRPPQTERPSR
ncbi:hypothetical protein [Actinomadura sp. 3N508]|uniref:hypothetical protein n=1 Tax=Actinomadura sp. 3N508 TaxID=3375153 RepID=UPI0037B33B77